MKSSLLHIQMLAVLVMTAFALPQAQAAEVAGVLFKDAYQDQGEHMVLQGTGLKNVLFIKAFAAGFYKAVDANPDLLGNYPKRIEVEYFVHIPARKLTRFTIDTMKDNVDAATMDRLADEIKMMGRYFVDLKPGDRFALTYIPDVGTQFSHNDRLVGTIKGYDFAKALFSVWIGEKPFDGHLKKQVIGLSDPHPTKSKV